MRPVVYQFTTSKKGSSLEENEDFSDFIPKIDPNYKLPPLDTTFYAVADGATESSFAKDWATRLVKSYCLGTLCNKKGFTENLLTIQQEWQAEVKRKEKSLPWYALEKAQDGAFSSLVGLEISKRGTWEAIAVGDSCLFQVRNNELISKFPIENSSEFNNRPFLISSIHSKNSQLTQNTKFCENKWEIDDSFYLMSDAFACWFLQRCEIGKKPWEQIGIVREDKPWEQIGIAREDTRGDKRGMQKMRNLILQNIIDELRVSKEIRNDDVTLISINLRDK